MDLPKPIPRQGELLIRIRATSVTAGDCELRALRFGLGMRILVRILMGLLRPKEKILGQEFAGDVEAVGAKVGRFNVGDSVYGTTGFGFGAYADYLCLREGARDAAIALKPASVTYEEAATFPTGGMEALHLLRKAGSLRGLRVLVNGAGGGIGNLAVQLAKVDGAIVTGVETSHKLGLVRQLGVDHVIDSVELNLANEPELYDVIVDVVGRRPRPTFLRALHPKGFYLLANPSLFGVVRAAFASAISGKRVIARGSPPKAADLDYLRGLIDAGRIRVVLARCFTLEELVTAHRLVDSGLAIGRVAISVGPLPQ
ncbi:MAG TPA: NAD(P)-dependent alcohol dehydrogenase [Thermoplasmata archaeon]|nr:NAD(P)-dependent alcohol dehydrogenase [Thermoplasmata archaeon]